MPETIVTLKNISADSPESLLKSDIEQLDQHQDGRNLLHTALLNGDIKKVKTYLEIGADPTIKDGQLSRGCVGWGARGGSLACLLLLKEHMSESDWRQGLRDKDKQNQIALHLAATHYNDVDLFEFIYQSGNIFLLQKGQHGFNLYHIIFALHNNYSLFHYINSKLSECKRRILFKSHADDGLTAIAFHAGKNNIEAVQALLSLPEANKPMSYLSKYNTTPLMTAAHVGSIELIRLLLKHGQSVNYKSFREWTALSVALSNKQHHTAELLIEHGANVSSPFNDEGRTLLHWFIKNFPDNSSAVMFLLTHGAMASLHIEDIYGYRPFEWLGTDLDTYLAKLTGLELSTQSQIKSSIRKKGQILNFTVLNSILKKEVPAITPYIKDGFCYGYSFLGALSYFNNNRSLNQFYADQERLVSLSNPNDAIELSKEAHQWANDCAWMQQDTGIRKLVFQKSTNNRAIVRNWHFFGQRNRKEALRFASDKSLYGPFKQITYYFRATYDGCKWIAPDLVKAIRCRLEKNMFMEVYSWTHTNTILHNEKGYYLIEQDMDGEIKHPLILEDIVNLLINYHYIYPHSFNQNQQGFDALNIYPFSLRCWSFENVNEKMDYEATLHSELELLLKDKAILNYTSPIGGNLLHFCTAIDDALTLKTMIAHLPDININQTTSNSITPLHYAMSNYSENCIKVLAEHADIDVFCKNKVGQLLLLTAFYNEPEMFLLLMQCLKTHKPIVYEKINSTAPFGFFGHSKENKRIEKYIKATSFEELENMSSPSNSSP